MWEQRGASPEAEITPSELDSVRTDERKLNMEITINNSPHAFEGDSVLLPAVLHACNIPDKGIAVAINNKVVRKCDWEHTTVNHGDSITLIKAVCGG